MIRSELDVLLDKVKDEALRADLRTQIDRLKQRRSFGLVFERHIPERVRLPQHPIRVGSQVVSLDDTDSPTWEVIAIDDGVATMVQVRDPDGAFLPRDEEPEMRDAPLGSLVVISDFGQPVLPGFRHLGSIERGGDKPYHVVINGENHHSLEALRFTHAGKVDCIYIDPPYNTGARDWKYDNDYVDDTDAYRHSKWLAFMERRLKLAKDLLNPDDSVLIVTIDEKEYLRLGLLLEQAFPEADIQMVSDVINRAGTPRGDRFSRVDEYIFYLFLGRAGAAPWTSTMLGDDEAAASTPTVWFTAVRRGSGSGREDKKSGKSSFYPVVVDATSGAFIRVGDPLPHSVSRHEVPLAEGELAIWPLANNGRENRWRFSADVMRRYFANGTARLGKRDPVTGLRPITYLQPGTLKNIANGTFEVRGRTAEGALELGLGAQAKAVAPRTVWSRTSHFARDHGSHLLGRLLPGRHFPFPKSMFAVEDTLRFVVGRKPDAVVLDFFAGSGTTAHAVARLNRQDGGRRQSIMVTNNEVSADEAKELRSRGLRPGDPEWEALGIFEHITRPRVTAAITGRTPDGEPIKGDYKFTDEFPMADGFDENVAFLELRYLDADDVDLGLAYDDLAALLWLRAGAQGPIAPRVDDDGAPLPFAWTDHYGVLFDEDRWRAFVAARPEGATAAFIATWSPATFAGIAAELPAGMDVVRLYDTYLSMFLPERVGA
ncbi:MAG: site-specific DNA-methyltransferase [Candidatus Limnocylindrales bacterium]